MHWAEINIFGALQRFYEVHSSEVGEPSQSPGNRPSSKSEKRAEELSTAELAARVQRILLLCQAPVSSAKESVAVAAREPPRNFTVRTRFMVELQSLAVAHRMVTQFLCQRAAEVKAQEDTAPPLTYALTEAARILRASSDASSEPHLHDKQSNLSSRQWEKPSSFASAVESLTKVLSTNLYTISTFLEALDDSPDLLSSHGCGLTARQDLKEAILPPIFHLITLTLDLAAAAQCFATEQASSTPSRMPSIPCVLQQEGSHVLSCLLLMKDVTEHNHPCGDCSATALCHWVATHHLLRRLRDLLFTALPHNRSLSSNGALDSETALCEVALDRTDEGIVVWMAKKLDIHAALIPGYQQHSKAMSEASSTCDTPGHALPQQPSRLLPLDAAGMHAKLKLSCLVELLRILLQRLTAEARSVTRIGPASSAAATASWKEEREANTHTSVKAALWGDERRYVTLSSPRFAEYASALGPAMAQLRHADAWDSLPSSLRASVEALQTQLQHLEGSG
ncbi:hypothetical protein ABL78_3588 [Leptomonas seymouri]|uniref:Uncharacterized protein n=1 Tax=Leptomonas seymouri TaxID=5684 RepID=A0A0N1I4J4_LEPSE|nr:hypothetical protein ABL78_3588 [Leptomonas seymouri]|eukprot:KPI87305.1 hypothetical protein ABL78_3588 [Leptomonas seymouri]